MTNDTLIPQQQARYDAALDREVALRKEWKRQGGPMVTLGGSTGMVEVIHPLLAEMRQAEAHASRMAKALHELRSVKRAPGRPPGAASAPDRQGADARPGILRAVK
jgi:hypothetical protein